MFQTAVDKFPNTAIKIVGRYSSGTCLTAVGSGPCTWRQRLVWAPVHMSTSRKGCPTGRCGQKKETTSGPSPVHTLSLPFGHLARKGRHAPLRHTRRDDLLQRSSAWRFVVARVEDMSWNRNLIARDLYFLGEQSVPCSRDYVLTSHKIDSPATEI